MRPKAVPRSASRGSGDGRHDEGRLGGQRSAPHLPDSWWATMPSDADLRRPPSLATQASPHPEPGTSGSSFGPEARGPCPAPSIGPPRTWLTEPPRSSRRFGSTPPTVRRPRRSKCGETRRQPRSARGPVPASTSPCSLGPTGSTRCPRSARRRPRRRRGLLQRLLLIRHTVCRGGPSRLDTIPPSPATECTGRWLRRRAPRAPFWPDAMDFVGCGRGERR
jgi:hypothetical protein